MTPSCPKSRAELSLLCPDISDVNPLGEGQGIVDINAEIPLGALDIGVTQQQLNGVQIFLCGGRSGLPWSVEENGC